MALLAWLVHTFTHPATCRDTEKGRKVKLKDAPTKAILTEIAKFQRAQKRYPAMSQIHADIGKQLAPLFAEMARRTAK